MNAADDPLYLKLLGETAPITWDELQPHFARGVLLWVAGDENLVAVAHALALNDQARVGDYLAAGRVGKLDDGRAGDLLARGPRLWAVVVAPWVLVQERSAQAG